MKDAHTMPSIPRMTPTLSLSEEDCPDIKDWKVGGKYKLELEVEQVSASKNEGMMEETANGKNKISARFKVLDVKIPGKKYKDKLEQKESEKEKKVERMKEKAENY